MLSESRMSTGPTASSTPTQEDRLHLSDDLLDRHTHNLVPHGDYALTLGRWKPRHFLLLHYQMLISTD